MDYGKAEKREGGVMDYYFKTKQMSVGYQGKPFIRDIEIGLL